MQKENESPYTTSFFNCGFKTYPTSRKTVKNNYLPSWIFSAPTTICETDWLLSGLISS
jgi:hypothetical protein